MSDSIYWAIVPSGEKCQFWSNEIPSSDHYPLKVINSTHIKGFNFNWEDTNTNYNFEERFIKFSTIQDFSTVPAANCEQWKMGITSLVRFPFLLWLRPVFCADASKGLKEIYVLLSYKNLV